MRKIIFFLLYSPMALAQLTTVTGTVKDPTGLPYANGTIVATLVISGSPRFSFNSLPYTPPTGPVGLDANGHFTMSLADVTQILPSGGTWSFHVCSATGTVQPGSPITAGPVCFDTVGLIISGSTQDISTPLSAAAPRLTSSAAGSGTVGPGTAGQFAVYSGGNTVLGSTHLDDGVTAPSTITSSENFQVNNGFGSVLLNPNSASITLNDITFAPTLTVDGNGGIAASPSLSSNLINLFGSGAVVGHGTSTPVPPAGSGAFGFLSPGIPAISTNGGPFTAAANLNPTSGRIPLNSSGAFIDSPFSATGSTSNVTMIGNQLLVPNCGGTLPQFAIASAPNFGICIDPDGSVGFLTGGSQAFRVLSGVIVGYNSGGATENTAGQGVSWIPCATSQKAETGADASIIICSTSAGSGGAGSYRVRIIISVSAASSATLGWTATWTDSNGNAQTPANLSLFQAGTAAPALTFTTSTAGNYYGFADVDVNGVGGIPIIVKTTFSGTSIVYKVSATIERLI